MSENRQKRKAPHSAFRPGNSANPGGRPKLPPEIKAMKEQTLDKAVRIMHAKVNDARYVSKLKPGELTDLLSLVFDRCGLPKVSQIEGEIADTKRIVLIFPEADRP